MDPRRRHLVQALGGATFAMVVDRNVAGASLASGRCESDGIAGFQNFCFTDDARTRHDVYVAEGGGPPLVMLHELPGLVDADLKAALRFQALGYTVVVPLLFGKPGGAGHAVWNLLHVCGRAQFACGDGDKTSPQVKWLRDLTRAVRERWPAGRGVGILGMCLTGAFPIAMLREPSVAAVVLCQPTIPFNAFTRLGWFTDEQALGVDPDDLRYAKTESTAPLLGIRYSGDWRSRPEKFQRLAREFEQRFYRLDLAGAHHSTLAGDLCDDAQREASAFFNQFLRTPPLPDVDAFPRRSKPNMQAENTIGGCEVPHGH